LKISVGKILRIIADEVHTRVPAGSIHSLRASSGAIRISCIIAAEIDIKDDIVLGKVLVYVAAAREKCLGRAE